MTSAESPNSDRPQDAPHPTEAADDAAQPPIPGTREAALTDARPIPDPVPEGVDKAAPLGMPAKIGLAVLAVAVLAALFWPRGESSFEAPGGFLVDGDGRPVPLAQRLAPVTLVHFWATWCAPCITEIPALQELARDFQDEPDFDLVMIAVENEAQDVDSFLGSLAPMALFDPTWEVAHRYGTRKLPETYLVVNGEVLEAPSQERLRQKSGLQLDGDTPRWVGQVDWGDPQIRAELRAVLDGGPESEG